jgi:hypothetical protein
MAPTSISTTHTHMGSESSTVVLLEIYRALQRLENRLEGQDERLSIIEVSIHSESASLGDRLEILSLNSINDTPRRFSLSGSDHREKPISATSGGLQQFSAKEQRRNTYEFQDSGTELSLTAEKPNDATIFNLPHLDRIGVAIHPSQAPYVEDDIRSVSVYSTQAGLEAMQSPPRAVWDGTKDLVQNKKRPSTPPKIPARSPLRDSLDSPISIAYSDVASDQLPNTERPGSSDSQKSATSSSKARKHWAKASATAVLWTRKVKAEVKKEKLQIAREKLKSKVPNWNSDLVKVHLAHFEEFQLQSIDKCTEMKAMFMSRLGTGWAISKKFWLKQKTIWTTGWVLY